ncbi:MAG: methylated-DNA--[protein]-cysteine S-methyltransferase [Burkholderiaceae bacterium]
MKFDASIVQSRLASPLGSIILAASDKGLAGLWFEGHKHLPEQAAGPSAWPVDPEHPVLVEASRQLKEYFAGLRTTFELPLDLQGGTAFQRSVWRALLTIPSGATTSYGALSSRIGRPAAVRAVGAAVGRNPVGIVVPCHRVVGTDGSLTGYAGGLDRKTALLQLEGALT